MNGYISCFELEESSSFISSSLTDIFSKTLKKENDWLKFGYEQSYLDAMKKQEFWDNEYHKIEKYNDLIIKMREQK